jgi:aspartyl-tRNA(Asn)/glutamyl-tRNA(Gln) amidotransferase subunit A
MDDVLGLGAARTVEAYRARALSPVEVTRAAIERALALQPRYGAFVELRPEEALAAARESERRWQKGAPIGLVDGLPTTVKDLLQIRGWETRRGSLTTAGAAPAAEDSASVARLREQGAVFIGKTATPEFGWKGVTDSAVSGIARNPWNEALTPGGSSGGAAVAAATGMGVLHLATDGGGSIRIPAAFCGVFGFKPTFGLVPVHPHPPPLTLWHQGPLARGVEDAALMLTVIAGHDARDFYAAPPSGIDFRRNLDDGLRDIRIAYSPTLGYANVQPQVLRRVERAVAALADLGAEVETIELGLQDPIEVMRSLWSVALALAVRDLDARQRAGVEGPVLEIAERGMRMSALQYRDAEKQREALARRFSDLHRRFHLLVTPQMPLTAFEAGREVPRGSGLRRWWEWSPFTYPFNLTQQPAATMPCGFADDGLPVAIQIIGAKFQDALVMRAARAFESRHPIRLPDVRTGDLRAAVSR